MSQPPLPVLQDHRCSDPCHRRRWQAWPGRAGPDPSRSCLPHHLQCSALYPALPFENPFTPDRHGANGASLWAGRFRLRTDRRAIVRRPSRAFLTRAGSHAQTLHERFFRHLLIPHLQLDELRTRLRCAKQIRLSVVSHWSSHPASSCAPSGSPHAAHGAQGYTHPTTDPGRLSASRSSPVMGSISPSMRLAAHLGHWLPRRRRGRKVLRWQVAAGLIYGQVIKC